VICSVSDRLVQSPVCAITELFHICNTRWQHLCGTADTRRVGVPTSTDKGYNITKGWLTLAMGWMTEGAEFYPP
jgi:hypothetical protein